MDRKDLIDKALEGLMEDEGFRGKPYRCPAGKLTIGFGRNLDDKGISRAEGKMLLLRDIVEAVTFLNGYFTGWMGFSMNRQVALVNMAVNLGPAGLKEFKKMVKCILFDDWDGAAREAEESLWFKQVGNRAKRLIKLIKEG